MGYIEYLLSSIAYHEGRFRDALVHQMNCHKLIKSLPLWNKSYELTFKILKRLKKYEDIDKFLNKIFITLNDCKDNSKDFESVSLYLGWNWNTVELLRARNFFEKSLKNNESIFDLGQLMNDSLKSFVKNSKKFGCLRSHILLANELIRNVENKLTKQVILGKKTFRKIYKLSKNTIALSEKISVFVKRNLKYLYSSGMEVKQLQSPLYFDLNNMKLCTARLENFIGELKQKSKNFKISIKQIESLELSDQDMHHSGSELEGVLAFENAIKDLPEKHVRYLMRLNREVEKVNSPKQKRLDSFERATLLARQVKDYYENLNSKNLEADLEILRGLRLKRKKLGKFEEIWKDQISDSMSLVSEPNSIEEENDEESISEMLQIMESIIDQSKDRNQDFFNFIRNTRSFNNIERFSYEIINIYGDAEDTLEIALSSLVEYQSNLAKEYFWQEIKVYSRSEYKPILLKRLIQRQFNYLRFKEEKLFEELSNEYRLMNYLTKHEKFDKILDCLPRGASFVIFQFNKSMDELYLGYVNKSLDEEKPNLYSVRQVKLDPNLVPFLLRFIEEQQEINSLMFKTPLLTNDDLVNLENECEERYSKFMERFIDFMKPIFEDFEDFLNKKQEIEIEVEEKSEEPVAKNQKRANGRRKKQQDKKEGKTATNKSKNEGIEATDGGVTSLTLLVDSRFITLPFELLDIFKSVPLISKDFSLQSFHNRLNLDEEKQIINTCEFSSLRYIAYDFKDRDLKSKEDLEHEEDLNRNKSLMRAESKQSVSMIEENIAPKLQLSSIFQKMNTLGVPSVPQGIDSSVQMPSMGDWVRSFQNSSIFVYYGNKALMNMISSRSLVDMVNGANMEAMILVDRINPLKKIIEKVNPIEKDFDLTPLVEFPKRNLVLSTLLGARFSVCNKVNIDPEANVDLFDTLFRKIANNGEPLGKFLHEFRKGKSYFVDEDGRRIDLDEFLPEIESKRPSKKTVKSEVKGKDRKKGGQKVRTSESKASNFKVDPSWKEEFEKRKLLHLQNYIVLGVPFFNVEMK